MSESQLRPPAVPLITQDPFFSIWSFNDNLTDDWTKHWTGKNQALCGMVRVDGKCFRWMSPGVRDLPVARQVSLRVTPCSTAYTFEAGGVRLNVSFWSNLDLSDPAQCSRSDARVLFSLESTDGRKHRTAIYFDASSELVVDNPSQKVLWSRLNFSGPNNPVQSLTLWHEGGEPLNRVGDDHRIDWGKLHMLVEGGESALGESESVRATFAESGRLPAHDNSRMPRAVSDGWPVAAWSSGEFEVGSAVQSRQLRLCYDDEYSIEYFHRPLRAAWRSENGDWESDLSAISRNDKLDEQSDKAHGWSENLMERWAEFGPKFADLAVLSYRQSLAGHKIVKDIDGRLLMFGKENFSNGCIGTVDVMYPACPIFLANNPELVKANMEPVLEYAGMPRWKWKFAPHDLGTYPKANGQVYGGGERTEEDQMPVEESANMLIMAAAYLDKTGDAAWIHKYWKQYSEWAEYLKEFGVDPGNQLCTDDFAGHLAHNANLSLKAIVAMACYAKMCPDKAEGAKWRSVAEGFVKEWMKMADDGDHYRLAFDKPGSWSQKYNLVWDKVLGLKLFPQEVYDKEVAWYLKHLNKYGLPLDNRADYTKLDWTVWTACLASKKEDFDAIMAPVYTWVNETPDRIPLTDWYDTKSAKCIGFRARTVVGGVFMPLLLKK